MSEGVLQTDTHVADPEKSPRRNGPEWDEAAETAADAEDWLPLEIEARVLAPFVTTQRETSGSHGDVVGELSPREEIAGRQPMSADTRFGDQHWSVAVSAGRLDPDDTHRERSSHRTAEVSAGIDPLRMERTGQRRTEQRERREKGIRAHRHHRLGSQNASRSQVARCERATRAMSLGNGGGHIRRVT